MVLYLVAGWMSSGLDSSSSPRQRSFRVVPNNLSDHRSTENCMEEKYFTILLNSKVITIAHLIFGARNESQNVYMF